MQTQEIIVNKEKRLRSGLKAISWRFFATLTTIIISYIVTGSSHLAASIGVIELVLKIALYYIHERIWQYLRFIR